MESANTTQTRFGLVWRMCLVSDRSIIDQLHKNSANSLGQLSVHWVNE